jgi:hypothetical protein
MRVARQVTALNRRPRVLAFPRPQPRRASGLHAAMSAGHLNEARNAFQQAHRTWDRGRTTTACVLVA